MLLQGTARSTARSTITGWTNKTPPGFAFALKVPQVITHEKCLEDCEGRFPEFRRHRRRAGKRQARAEAAAVSLFQSRHVQDRQRVSLARRRPFLRKLRKDHQFAFETRNKTWLDKFMEILCEHKVALTLLDQAWMPDITELTSRFDPISARFTYVRWLGDRKAIEERTKLWDKTIVDRRAALSRWVDD